MKNEENLFAKHDYIFDKLPVKGRNYEQSLAHLAKFCDGPNDWRDHDLEEALAHYKCSFDKLPVVERDIYKRELARWYGDFGPKGSVAKELREHFKVPALEKETDAEDTRAEFDRWQTDRIAVYNPSGWIDRLLDGERSQTLTGIKEEKTKARSRDLDKD